MDASQLKSIPLFADVPDEELAQIAGFAQEVTVDQGRELVREGDFSYEFMAIEEGEAEVTRDGQHLADLGPATSSARWACSRRRSQRHGHGEDAHEAGHAHRLGPEAHGAPHPRGDRAGARDARRAPPGLRHVAARIVLFGATGYTGRLTAEAMVERG